MRPLAISSDTCSYSPHVAEPLPSGPTSSSRALKSAVLLASTSFISWRNRDTIEWIGDNRYHHSFPAGPSSKSSRKRELERSSISRRSETAHHTHGLAELGQTFRKS